MKADARPRPFLARLEALGDPTRLRLLRVLERHELGVVDLCEVLQLPQSTVSRRLKQLADGGWVTSRARGASNLYRMAAPDLDAGAKQLWRVAREETNSWPAARQDQLRLARRLERRRERSRSFFSAAAGRWDALRRQLYGEQFLAGALAALLPREWVVADLGCGAGHVAAELGQQVARVIGVDPSEAMLAAARRRTAHLPNVELRAGELERLPIDDACSDAALILFALGFAADPERALGETARVLRPGGRVVIVDQLPHDRDDLRQELGQNSMGFEPQEISDWMLAVGLTPERVQPLPPSPDAKGPALFLAAARREPDHNGRRRRGA